MVSNVERLEATLSVATSSQHKIDIMNELAWELRERDTRRAFNLSEEAYALAEQEPCYQMGQACSLAHLGYLNYYKANYGLALSQTLEAISLFEALGHLSGLPRALSIAGSTYLRLGDYAQALPHHRRALSIAQEIGDQLGKARALNGIALVYVWTKDHQQALTYFNDALHIYEQLEDANGQVVALSNLSMTYRDLQDYEQSLHYGKRCLDICHHTATIDRQAIAINNIGCTLMELGSYQESLEYFDKSLALSQHVENKFIQVSTLLYLGKLYLKKQSIELSQSYLNQALKIAEDSEQKGFQFECHQALAETYKAQGNFERALQHYELFHDLKETIFNEEATNRVKHLEVHHNTQTARQEAEISRLQNAALEQEIAERKKTEQAFSQRIQQLEAIRTVTTEITRELELPTLIDVIIHHMTTLVGATTSLVLLWNEAEDVLTVAASHGTLIPPKQIRIRPGEGVVGRVAARREGLMINDYLSWPEAIPRLQAYARGQHLQAMSMLAEPMLYRERLIGVIVACHSAGRHFTTQDRDLLVLFAAQAAIAIENAHLFEESTRRQEQLASLLELNKRIAASEDMETLMARVAEEATRLVNADGAIVRILQGESLIATDKTSYGTGIWSTLEVRLGEGISGLSALENRTILVPDIQAEPLFRPVSKQQAAVLGLHSFAAIPICGKRGVVGVLGVVARRLGQLTAENLPLLSAYAEQAAIAIENAYLLTVVEERTVTLEQTNVALRHEIAERQQIASRFRDLVQGSLQAVMVYDRRIFYANTQAVAMFGYTALEALLALENVEALFHPEDTVFLREKCQPDTEQEPYAADSRILRGKKTDGTTIYMEAYHRVVNWPEGPEGKAIQGVYIDVTERITAERERAMLQDALRQAQKMEAIGTLAGGIAHDFNNTLGVILGYTDLALDSLSQNTPLRSYLQQVLTACHRAKDLVQQILTFSRKSEQTRKPVNIAHVVEETLKFIRPSLPTTIDIRPSIERDTGMVLADVTQLHQVLMNLCANAEYAMRTTGGSLEVCLDTIDVDAAFAMRHPELSPGSYARLVIRDTGHGMTPVVLERAFEPFFTTKDVGEGTGMGLAVVHGIITKHNGAITVQSAPGQGTTFTLYLPRIAQALEPEGRPRGLLSPGKGHILLVDDEASLAYLNQTMLERCGYDVVLTTSSNDALELFRTTPQQFDLVITDQTMPTMTGVQLTGKLRQLRPDIPIILCTGFSHVIDAEKAQALGIDAFLLKPVVMQELVGTIQRLLTQRTEAAQA